MRVVAIIHIGQGFGVLFVIGLTALREKVKDADKTIGTWGVGGIGQRAAQGIHSHPGVRGDIAQRRRLRRTKLRAGSAGQQGSEQAQQRE